MFKTFVSLLSGHALYFRALSRHSTEMAEKYNKNLSEDTWCPRQDFQVSKFQKQIKLPFFKIFSQIVCSPSPMLTKVFC